MKLSKLIPKTPPTWLLEKIDGLKNRIENLTSIFNDHTNADDPHESYLKKTTFEEHKTSSHHDQRYFTKTQTNALLEELQELLESANNNSDSSINDRISQVKNELTDLIDTLDRTLNNHKSSNDHDDRYYVKATVNSKISALNSSLSSAINDLTASLNSKTGNLNSELDSVRGLINTTKNSLSSSLNSHKSSGDHDERYYTKGTSDGRFSPAIKHNFSGTYPMTVSVDGKPYSHPGITFRGSDATLAVDGAISAKKEIRVGGFSIVHNSDTDSIDFLFKG
jgi:ElaB/YqjD/DUF883 family membrane-anchored ribosome-binding protein